MAREALSQKPPWRHWRSIADRYCFYESLSWRCRPERYGSGTRAVLFCLRSCLQDKFIGGGFQLQILIAANKGDNAKDKNHQQEGVASGNGK